MAQPKPPKMPYADDFARSKGYNDAEHLGKALAHALLDAGIPRITLANAANVQSKEVAWFVRAKWVYAAANYVRIYDTAVALKVLPAR